MSTLRLGGATMYALGVIPEEYNRLHFAVPVESVGASGNRVPKPMMLYMSTVANAMTDMGFEGPTFIDIEKSCVRFMFSADALKFNAAFRRSDEESQGA